MGTVQEIIYQCGVILGVHCIIMAFGSYEPSSNVDFQQQKSVCGRWKWSLLWLSIIKCMVTITPKYCTNFCCQDVWVWYCSLMVFILPSMILLTTLTTMARSRTNYQQRVTRVMMVITLCFLVCWWPYALVYMTRQRELVPRLDLLWNNH